MRIVAVTFILFFAATWTASAAAQCTSNASSCVACHEARGKKSVLGDSHPWHAQHGFGDLCAACHGGDPSATEQVQAHAGRQSPLAEPRKACASCHTDAEKRAVAYLAVGSSTTAPPSPSSIVAVPHSNAKANRLLTVLALILAVALLRVARRRKNALPRPPESWLKSKTYDATLAGTLLGLLVAGSEVFWGRPVAVAGAFDRLAAYGGKWLFPARPYYAFIMVPAITWQIWLVLGLMLGSFAASKWAGQVRGRWLPDSQWQPRFGASKLARLAIAFLGAMLVQIGAGIAGGCTSGLAISGGALLAPAAFLFMAGMFAAGIPTAWLWYRRRRDT